MCIWCSRSSCVHNCLFFQVVFQITERCGFNSCCFSTNTGQRLVISIQYKSKTLSLSFIKIFLRNKNNQCPSLYLLLFQVEGETPGSARLAVPCLLSPSRLSSTLRWEEGFPSCSILLLWQWSRQFAPSLDTR